MLEKTQDQASLICNPLQSLAMGDGQFLYFYSEAILGARFGSTYAEVMPWLPEVLLNPHQVPRASWAQQQA